MLNQKMLKNIFSLGASGFVLLFSGVISCEAQPTALSKLESIGPSFNCAKASSVIEKAICSSENLSKLDLQLSNVYKTAKAINSDVKSEQRKWLKLRNSCKGQMLEDCLQKSYQKRIVELQLVKEGGNYLSNGWREFTHSKVIDELKLRSQCRAYENEKHIRYIDIQNINNSNELLILLCDPGAYQDAQMVYLLPKSDSKQKIKPVLINELKHDGGWKLFPSKKVQGNIQVDQKNNVFTVTRLYSGAATCGYVASYSLEDLQRKKSLSPISAKGDNDCFNGVRVDEWPVITFTAH